MTPPLVQVVLGSTRQGRAGERVARWFLDVAADRDDLRLELVDLSGPAAPCSDRSRPAAGEDDDPAQVAWAQKVAHSHALVTLEYDHGCPAVLENALDTVCAGWAGKPVAFVGYGGSAGGVRAVEQLRQVVVERDMVPLRPQVALPRAHGDDDDGALRHARPEREAARLLDALAHATPRDRP